MFVPEITSDEVQYVFYIETVKKFRKYMSVIDDMLMFNPIMMDATRFTMFSKGLETIRQIKLKDDMRVGFVKITTHYEFREVK